MLKEVPRFLEYVINCEDYLTILNDFSRKVPFYKISIESFIKMIPDTKSESVRNTLFYLLLTHIIDFQFELKDEQNFHFFDFY